MPRALVLALCLPLPLAAQSADEKKATIRFVAGLLQPDGGFISSPLAKDAAAPKSSLRATSAAVRVIKYFSGDVPHADQTTAFVMSCYDRKTGGFADQPKGTPDVALTAIGMMAAAELYPDRFDSVRSNLFLTNNAKSFEERRLAVAGMEAAKRFPRKTLDVWFAEISRTANPDGTFGKGDAQARETGGVIATFLRAGETLPDDQRKAAIRALQAGQRSDGGFGKPGDKGSDGETTYRVMRAFHLLKEKPKSVDGVRQFFARCRNADGGYGVAPGQPSTVSGTYYAAAVSRWLGE